jgi:hypothetical protein
MGMKTLADIRKEYPGYSDMSDKQLADSLYGKYYSDMNRSEFDSKVGLRAEKVSTSGIQEPTTGPGWSGKYLGPVPVGPYAYGALGAAKEVARFGAETAGLVGGGIAGAPFGPVGAVAGAGLGYGMVKAGERFMEGEKATLPKAALITAKDVGTGALMETGGQLVGGAVKSIKQIIGHPIQTELPQYAIEDIIAAGQRMGITLSPAEATGSKALALIESMFDKSPFSTTLINAWRQAKQLKPMLALREKLLSEGSGGEQIETLGQKIKDQVNTFLGQFKSLNEAQVNQLRDNVLTKLGSKETYESLGKTVQEAVAERSKVMYQKANDLYARVGELIPEGATVNIENMKSMAKQMLDEQMAKPPAWRNVPVIKKLEGISGPTRLEQEISQYPEAMQTQIREQIAAESGTGKYDWKTVQGMRSDLGKWIAESDAAIKTTQPGAKFQSSPDAGIYKQLRSALDKDINVFATESGGNVKQAFDVANVFYREGKMVYNAPEIRKLLSENPGTVVDMIFKPGGREEVDLVTKAVGKDFFEKTVKPIFTKKLLDTGTVFDPKGLQANIKKYGEELLQKVYNTDELKTISGLASDGKIVMEEKLAGNSFIKAIAGERPEVVVDSILGSYERFPGSKQVLKNVDLIKSIVTKETMDKLKYEFTDRLFKINQPTGYIQPVMLSATVNKFDRVLKQFYTPEQVGWIREVSEIAKKQAAAEMLARNTSGTAQNIIVWGQVGAVLAAGSGTLHSILSGDVPGATWKALSIPAIIMTPAMMTKIYLSPAGRKYFTQGMKETIGSGKSAEIITKIAEVTGINIQDYWNKSTEIMNKQGGVK